MSPHRFRSSLLIVAAVLSLGGTCARADLAATSPFLPAAGQSGVVAPTTGGSLEFRGVTTSGGTTRFSIFDTSKKSGTWIGLNESGYDFAVKKYDADSDTVTVDYQGRSMTLAMRTPKVASLGNAVAPLSAPVPMIAPIPAPINGNAAPQPNLVTRNVTAAATPAAEAARLADWQAEIQRRRDMRAQTINQPVQAAPQVQQQAQPVPQPQQQNNQRQGGGGGGPRRRN